LTITVSPLPPVSDSNLRVETVAVLVEGGDGKCRAEPHRAGIRRQDSGQHVDQSGLAAAVGSDNADAVAALNADREVVDDGAAAIALADALGLDYQRAGGRRRAGGDDGLARGGAIVAARLAQRL
jgi:hypothetical protein